MSSTSKFLPKPTPETYHFWEGTRMGELRLQNCDVCKHIFFPPQPFCPKCLSRDICVYQSNGRGRLYSYVINYLPAPGFTTPFSIAVVELDEGPRMMTNIVECPQTPEALIMDMPLVVVYERQSDDITLPLFKPVKTFNV